MNVFREILIFLKVSDMSDKIIYKIFGLLDDYTCNTVHDEIFDLLCNFLMTKDSALLMNVEQICRNNLEN